MSGQDNLSRRGVPRRDWMPVPCPDAVDLNQLKNSEIVYVCDDAVGRMRRDKGQESSPVAASRAETGSLSLVPPNDFQSRRTGVHSRRILLAGTILRQAANDVFADSSEALQLSYSCSEVNEIAENNVTLHVFKLLQCERIVYIVIL